MTHKIKDEVMTLYNDLKKNNLQIDKDMVMTFFERMPEEAMTVLTEMQYGKHIVNREFYNRAIKYIKDYKGNPINTWTVSDVMSIADKYINIDDEPYYNYDLAFQANARKGDYGHIVVDSATIIRLAIADLSDKDYIYGEADERAYEMAKCLIEKHES